MLMFTVPISNMCRMLQIQKLALSPNAIPEDRHQLPPLPLFPNTQSPAASSLLSHSSFLHLPLVSHTHRHTHMV
jgi:hypothetical protein